MIDLVWPILPVFESVSSDCTSWRQPAYGRMQKVQALNSWGRATPMQAKWIKIDLVAWLVETSIITVETMNSLRSCIIFFPTEMHPSKVLTKVTWDLIMTCCPNLLTLCIEGTIVNNLTGIKNLPSSIEQIYMSDCHGHLSIHPDFKKCKTSISV